jgi:hypothetical protein
MYVLIQMWKQRNININVYLQRQKSKLNPQIILQRINIDHIDHIRLGCLSSSYPSIYTIT